MISRFSYAIPVTVLVVSDVVEAMQASAAGDSTRVMVYAGLAAMWWLIGVATLIASVMR